MSDKSDIPANITDLSQRRAIKQSQQKDLFELLSLIDELEEALDTLDEHGLETRQDLEALIADLEQRAADLESGK